MLWAFLRAMKAAQANVMLAQRFENQKIAARVFNGEKMPRRPTSWRVRVMRKTEAFVDVRAFSAVDAETQAWKVPGVVAVFPQSAIEDAGPADVHHRGEDE